MTATGWVAALDKQEHKNWVTVGCALNITKNGIVSLIQGKMEAWYQSIISSPPLQSLSPCTCAPGPFKCGTCDTWKKELKLLHSSGQLKWGNSDRNRWGSPNGTWEIAKIFMSTLGTRKTDVVDAETTDIGGLLNLLEFCPFIQPPVSPKVMASARDQCRNRWTHAPKQELQDADVKIVFGHLNSLLNDPVFSSDEDAQKSSKDLQDLFYHGLVNVRDSEVEALYLLRQSLVAELTNCRDDLDDVQSKVALLDREIKKVGEVQKDVLEVKEQGDLSREEIAKSIQQLVTELKNVEAQLKEKISMVLNIVEDFNTQLHERDDLQGVCDLISEDVEYLKSREQNVAMELATIKSQVSHLEHNLSSVANQAATNTTAISSVASQAATNTTAISSVANQAATNTTAISSVANQAATNATAITVLQKEVFGGKEKLKPKPLQGQSIDGSKAIYTAPARLTAFSGRETALAWLEQNLTPHHNRENYPGMSCCTKTVCGLGGCGKTSLVVEFAWKYENLFPGGVFWINGESDENIHASVLENLTLLNTSAWTSEEIDDTLNRFLVFLSEKKRPWLLVLDNADELEDRTCPKGVKKMCKGPWQRNGSVSKHGQILLTTRQPVKVIETFLKLSPDDCLALQCFSEEEGASFLMRRTRCEGEALYQEAINLVNELGALPLALEQAAAYISALHIPCSFKQYLDKYRDVKLRLLEQQPVMALGREAQHRLSTHTTWLMNIECVRKKSPAAETVLNIAAFLLGEDNPVDVIYPILSELEQRELRDSVHPEFDVAAILKVLSCYSLISVNKESNEFRVHKLVQEVVRQSLTTSMRKKVKEAVHKGLQKVSRESEESITIVIDASTQYVKIDGSTSYVKLVNAMHLWRKYLENDLKLAVRDITEG